MHLRLLLLIFTLTITAAACSPSSPEEKPSSPAVSLLPSQAELNKLKADPLPVAREASKLEFWAHYKLMQATGMEEALGGEERAVAALKAVAVEFEHSAQAMRDEAPRMIPAAFDGNGMGAGVAGVGYGLVGGLFTGALSGSLTQEQINAAVEHGPLNFNDASGSLGLDIAQDGMSTTMEQTVNDKESGLTGKVKTKIHMDACPDAEGKLEITIESESQMSAGGASGKVTVRYRMKRRLDDDAHLLPPSEDNNSFADDMQLEMSGTGAKGNLSVSERRSEGTGVANSVSEQGHSIFRPDEIQNSERLRSEMYRTMQMVGEVMMNGSFGGQAPWESGRCVDLKVRSSPDKRKGAKPNTTYTLFAEPRAKKDGRPTGGTVRATLKGAQRLDPGGKVKADAKFDYRNPDKEDQQANIEFVARSKRGVGKATLEFDTKKGGYRIALDNGESITTCDITQPFSGKIGGGMVTLKFTPAGDKGGTMAFHFANGGGIADTAYDYTLSGPEDRMTGTFHSRSAVCGKAAGLTACGTAQKQTFTSTWTRFDGCDK